MTRHSRYQLVHSTATTLATANICCDSVAVASTIYEEEEGRGGIGVDKERNVCTISTNLSRLTPCQRIRVRS
jgi:hypothetical protein